MSDHNTFTPTPVDFTPQPKKPSLALIAVIILSVIAISGSAAFAFNRFGDNNKSKVSNLNAISSSSVDKLTEVNIQKNSSSSSSTNSNISSTKSLETSKNSDKKDSTGDQPKSNFKPKMEGQFETLQQDLGLYNFNGQTENLPTIRYSKAGKFLSGKYTGYDRIIMDSFPQQGDFGFRSILATQDYKTYTAEQRPSWYANTLDQFNQDKVKNSESDLGGNHTVSIALDSNAALYKIGEIALPQKDIDNLKLLKEYGSLKIYENKIPNREQQSEPTDRYKTEIYVKDEANLLQKYSLTTQEQIQKYDNDTTKFKIENKKYNDFMDQRNKAYNTERDKIPACLNPNTGDYSDCPKYIDEALDKIFGKAPFSGIMPPTVPSFGLSNEQIKTNLTLSNRYETFQPSVCGTVYGNVNLIKPESTAMESLGKTKEGTEIFKPKNATEWIKIQYDLKFSPYLTGDNSNQARESYEKEYKIKIPTLEEYSAKNPVLITKDIFGRYLLLGEFDYKMMGGCGKPVIYLYPTKTTDINLKFDTKMQIDVDIPKYSEAKGWNVRAKPNGNLQDLQTELTDCNQFQNPKFGQEYALTSCQNNNYPYIYWAGNTTQTYPQINSGFVVHRSELESSLKAKLNYIGLNQKETQDMLDYWLPQMLKKNKDYYRFSLIQTQELNQLFPMTISPKPESAIRVFLDWQELDNPIQISEQKLIQESRTGYTMIEWGGLKR
jgi:hypothetical protein